LRGCEGAGNSDCQLALDCGGGWSAIAVDEAVTGAGAVCERDGPGEARHHALILCIAATGGLCWTDVAFLGGEETSAADNRAFDQTWYAQILLGAMGLDVGDLDGQMGPRTREAIRKFQARIDVAETGELDRDLIDAMLTEFGLARFIVEMIRQVEQYRDPARANTEFAAKHVAPGGGGRTDKPGG
jgi:hypothetical protein